MGLFNNKKSEEKEEIPSLPELPALPEFPKFREENRLPKLPTYPSNTLGDRFSQSAIKDAVSGKKEIDVEDADEFAFSEEKMQMMQKPLRSPTTREIHLEKRAPMTREIFEPKEMEEEMPETRVPKQFEEAARRVKRTEPVFVRIDRFEESLKTFEEAKKKISDIEKLLKNINMLKEEEEKELNAWQNEIQMIKKKIEKVDQEIFLRLNKMANIIHIKLEYLEALEAKKEILSSEIDLLKMVKIIKRYNSLRGEELRLKTRLKRKITETLMQIRKLQRELPALEIPESIKRIERQYENDIPYQAAKKDRHENDLEFELREIQNKLNSLQRR